MGGSDLTKQQATAWANYQRMQAQLAGCLGRELTRETGLSEADYEILVAITESPDDSVRSLALRCGLDWEKSRLSHQLRRMTDRGLVTREECTEDNRGIIVRVTEAGRKALHDARQHYEAAVRRHVVDVLSAEQLDQLGVIAEIILAKMQDERLHQ